MFCLSNRPGVGAVANMQPQYLGAEYGAGFVLGLLTHVPPHAYISPRPDTSLRLWAADYIAVRTCFVPQYPYYISVLSRAPAEPRTRILHYLATLATGEKIPVTTT